MTAYNRLLTLRRTLSIVLSARALLGALIAGMLVWIPVQFVPQRLQLAILLLTAAVVAGALLLQLRALRSLPRIALWVEERSPSLRYALVTIAEGERSAVLDAQASSVEWWDDARRRALRGLVVPALVAGILVAFTLAVPRVAPNSGLDYMQVRAPGSRAARAVDVLAQVRADVAAPAYAGGARRSIDDPTSIDALVGSAITLRGSGDAQLLTAIADSQPRVVAPRSDGWSISLAMPARPALVRLHATSGRDRLIVLAPIADAVPAVTLLAPARDTIVRRAVGSLQLRAQLRDDIGLHDAAFELVVSSGHGENFTFRTATIRHTALVGQTESALEARLSLDSLALKPGDILQLRAIARDGNTIGGPGLGSSETRALRVARTDEYDSVSVDAAPPPEAEEQVLSQRMLIMLTEALQKRQRSLVRPTLIEESQKIAADQRKLRKRVGDVVFQRMGSEPLSEEGADDTDQGKLTAEQLLKRADSATTGAVGSVMDVEGDETPILAINKPLLEAFNAMWDAGRALEIGEPARALPPMRRALAAIERARQAERIYLRGRPSAVIVDLGKVRLSGKEKGEPAIREMRPPTDPAMRRRSATFERVTLLAARDPDAAADSLLLLRVDALGDAPVLAAALDDAARALRRRDSAASAAALIRVRRALGAPAVQRAGVSAWLGTP